MQKVGGLLGAGRQARDKLRIVNGKALSGLEQRIIVERARSFWLNLLAQILQFGIAKNCRSTAPPVLEAPPTSHRLPSLWL